jgi:hypothetical protein
VTGEDKLGAFMNYESADTTRFYCTACWTVLFGDHPLYEKRILVSQVAAYKEFEGLTNVVRMEPQARHFLKDLNNSPYAEACTEVRARKVANAEWRALRESWALSVK